MNNSSWLYRILENVRKILNLALLTFEKTFIGDNLIPRPIRSIIVADLIQIVEYQHQQVSKMEENYPEYKEKTATDKLTAIAQKTPMVPVGLAALVAIVGHGLYTFRNRKTRTSLFLINYRLMAQGTFLGCVTIGLAYTVFKNIWKRIHKE